MIEFLTSLLVILTGIYAYLTHRIAKANQGTVETMREQIRASIRPYVYFDLVPHGVLVEAHLRNTGQTAAHYVTITTDPQLQTVIRNTSQPAKLTSHTTTLLVPGREMPSIKQMTEGASSISDRADSRIEEVSTSFGADVFMVLYDYAARECNTGNQALAAELFRRVYERLKQPGGNKEAGLLSAFACALCSIRADGSWAVGTQAFEGNIIHWFPRDITHQFVEARDRFVAMTFSMHAYRKGLLTVVGGNTAGFNVKIQDCVHSFKVNDCKVVFDPPIDDRELGILIDEASRFQLTIPCMYMLSGAQSWW